MDGLPAIVSRNGGTLQAMVLEVVEGRIAAIYVIRNPDKLERLSGVLG